MKKSTKIIILSVLGIIILGIGYHLFNLAQNEKLWGHYPLFFLASLWAFYILISEKKFTKNGWRHLGLATLSGVILSISFPPIPLTFFMFIAFIPLLKIEKEISDGVTENPDKGIFKFAYHTFVTWNILTTWWVANTAFFASFIAIWLNSFFMCIPFMLFVWTKRKLPKFGYASLIAFWLAFEFIHLRWEISWTWLNLGNAFAQFPSWVQWYEFTGVPGGTLWILGANILIFKLFERANWSIKPMDYLTKYKWDWLKVKAFAVLPILLSLVMYFNYEDQGRDVEIVIVQPNYEAHYEKFRAPKQEKLNRFLRLSREQLTQDTEYLVFPETSFWNYDDRFINQESDIRALRTLFDEFPNLKLITGVMAYHIFGKDEPHSSAVREQSRNGETIYWEALNAAIQLEKNKTEIPFYIKSKLVPGAEMLPYRQLFGFVTPLVDHLGGSIEGHGTQSEREVFESQSGKIAPVICYESIYGEYHAGFVRNGAEAIFIVTNDGWWDQSPGYKQHLMFASLRAIETRRCIARSANVGAAGFINQRGDILETTKYGVEGSLRDTVKFNDELTFYVQRGDLIGRLGLFISVLLLLNVGAKRFLPKKIN